MKSEFDKILDEVIKKGMDARTMDSPSADFTQNLLLKTVKTPLLVPPPLISKRVWIFIGALVATAVLLGLLVELAVEPLQVLNSLSKLGIPEWNIVQIPDTIIYTICIAATFILIQVSWLNKYFQFSEKS